jgi:threonyl-tRNA synthetase
MPVITLPDGNQKHFDHPVSIYQVAESIGTGLAKAALAGKINDEIVDTSYVIEQDAHVSIITAKDDDGLEVLRHSCAHLMAQAVQQLFPTAQVTIGPVIEDGFFYDFAFERPFTPEDLEKIEKKMVDLTSQNQPVSRSLMTRDEAVEFFRAKGETYKVEIIEGIPSNQDLSFYQ